MCTMEWTYIVVDAINIAYAVLDFNNVVNGQSIAMCFCLPYDWLKEHSEGGRPEALKASEELLALS